MKRTYKNLDNLAKNVENDFTLKNLLHKRAYFKTGKETGWQSFNFEITNEIYQEIADMLGGNSKTKKKMISNMKNKVLEHWSLGRIDYSIERKRWEYTAGQDNISEYKEIRKFLSQ